MKKTRWPMTRGLGLLLIAGMLSLPGSALAAAGHVDPIAEALLTRQAVYFQSITSLEFESKMVMKMSEEVRGKHQAPADRAEWDLRYAWAGGKEWAELTMIDHSKAEKVTITTAYNGELYQRLDGGTTPTLTVTRTRGAMAMYGGVHPLVAAFQFTLLRDDYVSFALLHSAEKWPKLAEMVVSTKNTTMLGRKGITLELSTPSGCGEGETPYEIFFAEELDYLPIHWKASHPGGEVSVFEVTATQAYEVGSSRIYIPTSIRGTDCFADGERAQEVFYEIRGDTLKVNQPVDESIFTIPVSSAYRYTDADTGVTIKP